MKASERFTNYIIEHKEKFGDAINIFFKNMKQEADETKVAYEYIQKHLKGEKLTKEENNAIKEQFYDVLKSAGIIIPFAVIPGASLLIPILMKLCKVFNIPFENMLPSSFQIHDKIKKDIDKIDENTIV